MRGVGRLLLTLVLILPAAVAVSPPAHADDDPGTSVLNAVRAAASFIAGDDADAQGEIAAVASIEAAQKKLIPIANGEKDYGPTAVAAANKALTDIKACLEKRKQAAQPAVGAGAAPPQTNQDPKPAGAPTAGGGGGQNPAASTNEPIKVRGPAAPAALSDQRPTVTAGQAQGGASAADTLKGDQTVPLFRADAPAGSTTTSAGGNAFFGASGPTTGAPPGLTFRGLDGTPRQIEPGAALPAGTTVQLASGTTAAMRVQDTTVEAQAGADAMELTPRDGSDFDSSTFTAPGRSPIDVPPPALEVAGGGTLTVWQAVSSVFSGLWLTVTSPVRAGVDASLKVLLYLRLAEGDPSGALQAAIRVQPGGQVVIRQSDRGNNDVYIRGKADIEFAPPPQAAGANSTFIDARLNHSLGLLPEVRTRNADIKHRETAFTVEYIDVAGGERTIVSVTDGSVVLRDVATGKERVVRAGETDTVESTEQSASAGGAATAAAAAATAAPPSTDSPGGTSGGGGSALPLVGGIVVLAAVAAGVAVAWRRRQSNARL